MKASIVPPVLSGDRDSACKAGLIYFLVVFAIGFLLGTVRTLVLVPQFGEVTAVSMELPIILMASWFASHRLIAKFKVAPEVPRRLIMGGLAFLLLMLAEFGLSVFVFGNSAGGYLSSFETLHRSLGLLAQCAFALIPVLQARVT